MIKGQIFDNEVSKTDKCLKTELIFGKAPYLGSSHDDKMDKLVIRKQKQQARQTSFELKFHQHANAQIALTDNFFFEMNCRLVALVMKVAGLFQSKLINFSNSWITIKKTKCASQLCE